MTHLQALHHQIENPCICEKHPFSEPGVWQEMEYEPADAFQTEYGWELKRSGYVCPQCQAEEAEDSLPWLRQEQAWSDVA